MPIRPIHHRGDGEAAGEWGGCGGDRGHWRFWIGWGWEVVEFIRNGGARVWELVEVYAQKVAKHCGNAWQ